MNDIFAGFNAEGCRYSAPNDRTFSPRARLASKARMQTGEWAIIKAKRKGAWVRLEVRKLASKTAEVKTAVNARERAKTKEGSRLTESSA